LHFDSPWAVMMIKSTLFLSFAARRRIAEGLIGGRRVRDVAPAVTTDADVCLLGVAGKALKHAQSRAVFAYHCGGCVRGDTLICAGLHELADPKAAGVTRRLPGRQRVIGADHLVAKSDVGARAEEQRTIVAQVL